MQRTHEITKDKETLIVVDFDDTVYHVKPGCREEYHNIWDQSGKRMMRDFFPNESEVVLGEMLKDFWFKKGHMVTGIKELSKKAFEFPNGFPEKYYLKEDEIKNLLKIIEPNHTFLKWLEKIPGRKIILSDNWTKNVFNVARHLGVDLSIFNNEVYGSDKHDFQPKSQISAWKMYEEKYFNGAKNILFLDDNSGIVDIALKANPNIHAPWEKSKGHIESYFHPLFKKG